MFDRRRRDPLWRITERLSGENKVSARAVKLFYERIDDLIARRLEAKKEKRELSEEDGVDLLELFLQTTQDPYRLAGMIFSFLVAGRTSDSFLR